MTAKQSLLFEDIAFEPNAVKGLILTAAPGRPLTKTQRTFNRLISRIEDLRELLRDVTQNFERTLADYVEHIHPCRQREAALRKDLIRALAPFLERRRLRKRDQKTLSLVLTKQLDVLAQAGLLDDEDLRALFEQLHCVKIDELVEQDMKQVHSLIETMFADLGVDIDVPDFRADMTDDELAAISAEMEEEILRKVQEAQFQEASKSRRPKSKKQAEREEQKRQAEEARKRSIATIYKQLARVLHPDLEQDAGRRELKSGLMQKLTTAYRENDLHTLLSLELEWLQNEEGDIKRMTEEKLTIYNKVLREQVAELEWELSELANQTRFQPIIADCDWSGIRHNAVEHERRRLEAVLTDMEYVLKRLRSTDPLPAVMEVLQEFRTRQRAEKQLKESLRGLALHFNRF